MASYNFAHLILFSFTLAALFATHQCVDYGRWRVEREDKMEEKLGRTSVRRGEGEGEKFTLYDCSRGPCAGVHDCWCCKAIGFCYLVKEQCEDECHARPTTSVRARPPSITTS
ncbi:uncharacterized protein LOC105175490 [Sesamum indicum]|uniref:Uncharacterized protein LOC105175490 n=1 Tax=Sesamum indicum TaxID=4182 RepID=A0A6I9U663_SESIN|nr:uncharacterized protein LOC105175490 [Sesamum indicum]